MSETITTLEPVVVTASVDVPVYLTENERRPNTLESLSAMIRQQGIGMRVALPGIIQSFDRNAVTVSVVPAIRSRVRGSDGAWASMDFPVLEDVPVLFPSGGGFAITFPILPGDECLLVFCDRCIDSWWQSGGIQEQAQIRQHDISDAVALVGLYSQSRVSEGMTGGVYTGGVEIRNDAGTRHIRHTGDGWHILGNVIVQGGITASGDVVGQGTSLHTHVHGGVQSGGSNTGVPA